MRRELIFAIITALFISGFYLIPENVESIGTPEVSISLIGDFPGSDPSNPLDLSEVDESEDPQFWYVEDTWIVIEGEVEVTSPLPSIGQETKISLFANIFNDEKGILDPDHYFYPEIMSFEGMMPGESSVQNFTLHLKLDRYVPAGDSMINISGRWSMEPGLSGGSLQEISTNIHIAPTISAFLNPHTLQLKVGPTDMISYDVTIYNWGNELHPELNIQMRSEDDLDGNGVEIFYQLEMYSTGSDRLGSMDIELVTQDADPGSIYHVDFSLIDKVNDRILDILDLEIMVLEKVESPQDDDDDPPFPPDDDETPIELLTSEQCRRSYTDDNGDDLYYKATIYTYSYQVGNHPEGDARALEVKKEGDDLVIEITMGGPVGEWTSATVYILPNGDHKQRDYYKSDIENANIINFEPIEVLASNDLFAKGDYWSVSEIGNGNILRIVGDLKDLMRSGLNEDFEVIASVVFANPSFLLEDSIEDMEVELTIDYIGYGAGTLHEDGSSADNTSPVSMDMESMIKYGVGSFVVLIILLVVVVFFIVRKGKKKGRIDPGYYNS